jgi:hypothetical protein
VSPTASHRILQSFNAPLSISAAQTEKATQIAQHGLQCPYKKVEDFVGFLLKLNFQWQFLLRPLMFIICILKSRVYFMDMGNKMIVMWIVMLVPLATIFRRYYKGERPECREERTEEGDLCFSKGGREWVLEGKSKDRTLDILPSKVENITVECSKGKLNSNGKGLCNVVVA